MGILVAVAVIAGVCLLGFLALYACAWAIDRGIKDFIRYAREVKDDDRHRRT